MPFVFWLCHFVIICATHAVGRVAAIYNNHVNNNHVNNNHVNNNIRSFTEALQTFSQLRRFDSIIPSMFVQIICSLNYCSMKCSSVLCYSIFCIFGSSHWMVLWIICFLEISTKSFRTLTKELLFEKNWRLEARHLMIMYSFGYLCCGYCLGFMTFAIA